MTNRSLNERIEPCDLVKRLRTRGVLLTRSDGVQFVRKHTDYETRVEAADEIERLRAIISRPSSAPTQDMGASADAETGSHPTGQAELHRIGASRFDPARGPLPEYDGLVADVWDAYLRDLVGYEDMDRWARLPATFRWHEFWERLNAAIAAATGTTETNVDSAQGEASQSGDSETGGIDGKRT